MLRGGTLRGQFQQQLVRCDLVADAYGHTGDDAVAASAQFMLELHGLQYDESLPAPHSLALGGLYGKHPAAHGSREGAIGCGASLG